MKSRKPVKRSRKCPRGIRKSDGKCKRKPGPKRSRKIKRSRRRTSKKLAKTVRRSRKCVRGKRKSDGKCRRKPGPKRSRKMKKNRLYFKVNEDPNEDPTEDPLEQIYEFIKADDDNDAFEGKIISTPIISMKNDNVYTLKFNVKPVDSNGNPIAGSIEYLALWHSDNRDKITLTGFTCMNYYIKSPSTEKGLYVNRDSTYMELPDFSYTQSTVNDSILSLEWPEAPTNLPVFPEAPTNLPVLPEAPR